MGEDAGVVLVTGATGYVGGLLAPRLVESGRRVRCLARDPARLAGRSWARRAEIVPGDCLRPATLVPALRGVRHAYYLLQRNDLVAARNFGAAAAESGVELVVALGALGDPGAAAVGEALRASGTPVVELRAGPILGPGSLAFEVIRSLAERQPVLPCPRWMRASLQPIAIRDVLAYLEAVLDRPPARGRAVEIVGAGVTTFARLIVEHARLRDLHRLTFPLPWSLPGLSARWMHLVTPAPAARARALVEQMGWVGMARAEDARALFPGILPFDATEALRVALAALDAGEVETHWSDALATSLGDVRPVLLAGYEGMLLEQRQIVVPAAPQAVFRAFTGIGGEVGWLAWRWAWRVRGMLDRLVGGVGLQRGRRDPDHLRVGDALDVWRVEAVEPEQLLRLRAEMKMPGRAWLQFRVTAQEEGASLLTQTAFFAPRGLVGLLYWYGLYPVHAFVFRGLVRAVAARASGLAERKPLGQRSMHLPQASQRSSRSAK